MCVCIYIYIYIYIYNWITASCILKYCSECINILDCCLLDELTPLPLCNVPYLSPVILLALKSSLSCIYISTPHCLCLSFANAFSGTWSLHLVHRLAGVLTWCLMCSVRSLHWEGTPDLSISVLFSVLLGLGEHFLGMHWAAFIHWTAVSPRTDF